MNPENTNERILEKTTSLCDYLPIRDLTIADIIKIVGLSKDKAYSSVYYGEYRVGRQRRIRSEIFYSRRSRGDNICKC